VTCDFVENYTLIIQREVQPTYWNQKQAALCTFDTKTDDCHLSEVQSTKY
jgi:hypothetical protein